MGDALPLVLVASPNESGLFSYCGDGVVLLKQQVEESVRCGRRVKLSFYDGRHWSRIAPLWANLAASSPYSSFFLSVEWVSAWLEAFGSVLTHEILVFEDEGGSPVGACLLVQSTERRGSFCVRRLYLNTGGGDPAERPMMELNNLLCLPGWEAEIVEAMSPHLQSLPWDEFVIEGICPGLPLTWLEAKAVPQLSASVVVRTSVYVDLMQLRQSGASYESTLSANTREQLRRSMRIYRSLGVIRAEVAQSPSRAEEFFDEMCRMHESTWRGRGELGAFASARRMGFHRTLIQGAFGQGRIQLVKVSAGNETVGILYNFVHNGGVSFYQSGLNYKSHKHLKPGLVTHACAIQECLSLGLDDYDFLAGDARYKRSLANARRNLAWVVFSRPSPKMALIEFLRALRRGWIGNARKKKHRVEHT
jgi:CelD/BcsL family acetyltransferase involved in cellulose biosynthesis